MAVNDISKTRHSVCPCQVPLVESDAKASRALELQNAVLPPLMGPQLDSSSSSGGADGGASAEATSILARHLGEPWYGDLVPVVLQHAMEKDQVANAGAEPPPHKKRRGLSPYMMFKNSMLAAAKSSRGRTLSAGELVEIKALAKELSLIHI